MGRVPRATANGIEIEYETIGDRKGSPLLLISGLASQMISWDEEFCELLTARDFFVIRFDNRDSGHSTWMAATDPQYRLDDMAADAVGLLDALGVPAAHVVGASMGGFIAQLVAINHPDRALTLTSIMSGPSGTDEIPPTPAGLSVLLAPPQATREEQIAQGMWVRKELIGSLDPFAAEAERARVARAIDRAFNPEGTARQLTALAGAPSRLERLRTVRIPVLVVHGIDDILVPVENGRVVAAAVPGSRLLEIEGMGHDLPRRVWVAVADAVAELARQANPAC